MSAGSLLTWAIALVFIAILVAAVLLRRNAGGDMIEQQRRQSQSLLRNAPPPRRREDVKPSSPPSDQAGILAVPEIRAAIDRGRKIEAIRLVREATGMGLKEAKQLVERATRRL